MNIMVDIETTGTLPGCCVLSIAAVPIPKDIKPFYQNISHADCKLLNLIDDPDTLAWWDKQSEEAKEEAFTGNTLLFDALKDLSCYINLFENVTLWSRGKDFDFPILRYAYRVLSLEFPIHQRNLKCLRDLMGYTRMEDKPSTNVKHNALEDAKYQATLLRTIIATNEASNMGLMIPE